MTEFNYNDPLNDDTFMIYAAQNYKNVHCISLSEFRKDVKRIILARIIMRNYFKNGRIQIQLLLNHIIIFNNMFGKMATVRLFFFRCEPVLHPILKTIFDYMSILPPYIPEVKFTEIKENINIRKMLEKL